MEGHLADEALSNIWADDMLDREEDVQYIQKFLVNRLQERQAEGLSTHYVLNINSPWGTGKSFFLQRFAQQLESSRHVVARVDAWATDHADDPLLAVMASIEDALAPLMAKAKQPTLKSTVKSLSCNAGSIAAAVAKGAIMQGLKKVVGDAVDEVSSIIDADNGGGTESDVASVVESAAGGGADVIVAKVETLLNAEAIQQISRFRQGQAAIDGFKRDLGLLVEQLAKEKKEAPLFVLVDELDRCRPNYAISLLERAKHLFEVSGVVFIVATDTKQLASAIRAVYGSDFDSPRYLGRFFDRTYEFDQPDVADFVEHMVFTQPIDEGLMSVPPGQSLVSTLAHMFAAYEVNPREMSRAYDMLRTISSTWESKAKVEVTAMVPLIIARQEGLSGEWADRETNDRLTKRYSRVEPLVWNYHSRQRMNDRAEFQIGLAMPTWFNLARQQLPNVGREMNEDPVVSWIQRGLLDEFSQAHGSIHHPGAKGPFSIVRDYPALIRKAGRFVV